AMRYRRIRRDQPCPAGDRHFHAAMGSGAAGARRCVPCPVEQALPTGGRRMTMTMRSCAMIALACALAACGGEKSGTSAASGSNEVLKGTISDDMIAYDTLRSQPPAAKIVTESTG